MPIPKDIRIKDESADSSIKNLLHIDDVNIYFSKNAIVSEKYKGRSATIIRGILTDTPKACPCCGIINENHIIIRHSLRKTRVQLIPYQEVPTYLELYKQRFFCKACHKTFSAKTDYVEDQCCLSKPLKFAIAIDLKKKISMKDIAERYYVSTKSVERVLDMFYQSPKFNPERLPRHLLFDEFKGTKDGSGEMCFIVSDADTGKIVDILDDRRQFRLMNYFMRFSLKTRQRVTHVVMDMNASYDRIIKAVFPNAKISIDHFHIIQHITKAFNQQRIRTMNDIKKSKAPHSETNYKKFKKYWRIPLKKNKKINFIHFKQYPNFNRKFMTESEVLDYLLALAPSLKRSYQVYQELLDAFDDRNPKEFFHIIDHLSYDIDEKFKHSLRNLKKYRNYIVHSFHCPYSNGKLEGKNNLIKVIKRIAFGFKTFRNLKRRVMIQQGIYQLAPVR